MNVPPRWPDFSNASPFAGPPPERDRDVLVQGGGQFLDDITIPETATAVFLRSPIAHGIIRNLDISAAADLPGILAILTGVDAAVENLGTIDPLALSVSYDGSSCIVPDYPVLAKDRVCYCGQAIAMIIAENHSAAMEALEAIDVDYDTLSAVVDTKLAITEGGDSIHPQAPNNTAYIWRAGDHDNTDSAFETASKVVSLTVLNNRVCAVSMEPRSAMAIPEGITGDEAILCSGTQMPRSLAEFVDKAVPSPTKKNLRVVVPDVGGGFGMKGPVYPEQAAVLWAARKLNRPVRWLADRSESFLSDSHARDTRSEIALALDEKAKIVGLKLNVLANLGAFVSGHGSTVPQGGMGLATGLYRIPTYAAQVTGVFTNTAPVDAYRGAGRPEVIYALERIIDHAAREIGMDRAEFRRLNLLPIPGCETNFPSGLKMDDGNPQSCLDKALSEMDWSGFPARRKASLESGRMRGIGLSLFVDRTGSGGTEWSNITLSESGEIIAGFGTQSSGQGHAQSYRQLLSEALEVSKDKITILQGDTKYIHGGKGSYGSRSLILGGSAGLRAARDFIEKGRLRAATKLECNPADLTYQEGFYRVAGTDVTIDLIDLVDRGNPLSGVGEIEPQTYAFPYGCHLCEVEVDPETGELALLKYQAVDDYGTVINQDLAEGQLYGGIAQGLGQALLEAARYDAEGQLVTGSFTDYTMPRADNWLPPNLQMQSIPCLTNEIGAKGIGEAGAIAAPPTVISAILDALAPLGVETIDMPATPLAIWQAIQTATNRKTGVLDNG
jgi:carbon-monoxide dehydrogenase large subunit